MFTRKRVRLSGYNYSSAGYYFVTTCVQDRKCCLGKIENDEMVLNEYGKIVEKCWFDLPNHYQNCRLDAFIVMPNHVHGIIIVEAGLKPVPTKSLSEIMRGFKTFSSRRINESQDNFRFQWQRSFYDHIIRDERGLENIREYITYNPLKWALDTENPENI